MYPLLPSGFLSYVSRIRLVCYTLGRNLLFEQGCLGNISCKGVKDVGKELFIKQFSPFTCLFHIEIFSQTPHFKYGYIQCAVKTWQELSVQLVIPASLFQVAVNPRFNQQTVKESKT